MAFENGSFLVLNALIHIALPKYKMLKKNFVKKTVIVLRN